jgi:Ribonuclease G/E
VAGRGVLKTAETVCYEIFREILREARAYETGDLLVLASRPVVDRLLDEESANVGELESFIGSHDQLSSRDRIMGRNSSTLCCSRAQRAPVPVLPERRHD